MSDPSDLHGGHAVEIEREYNARAARRRAWRTVTTAVLEVPGANQFNVLESPADEHARLHQLARRLITA